jgi:dolichol-phosphate mannosyltransferase
MSYKNVSIVLSTYNESLDIELTVQSIIKNLPDCEIIIVDDNSPDGTFEIIKKINYPYLKIFCREETRGLASAFLLGVIESNGEFIGWIDANMGFLSQKLPAMVQMLSNYDMVVLSRYVDGGFDQRVFMRTFTSYLINLISRIILGSSLKDYTSGMFLMRRSVLKTTVPIAYGHGEFFIEFLYKAFKKGNKILEIPVIQPKDKKEIKNSFFDMIIFIYIGFSYLIRIVYSRFRKD